MVQDCVGGNLSDTIMGLYFNDIEQFKNFIKSSLTKEQIGRVIKTYERYGATQDVIYRELEAFAVAGSVNASSIAEVILKVCK